MFFKSLSITNNFGHTANILTAKNTNFCGVMISHVLLMPFWYLFTVPSTADKWHCNCFFGNIFLYYIVKQCTNIPKNTTFRGVMISPAHICTFFFDHIFVNPGGSETFIDYQYYKFSLTL